MEGDNLDRWMQSLAEGAARLEGCELLELNVRRRATKSSVELTIDRLGGVGVEDCAHVSRRLSAMLDDADADGKTHPFPGAYVIEVSSPGATRRLVSARDFQHFRGRTVLVETTEPVLNRRSFRGTLGGFDELLLEVKVDTREGSVSLPLAVIAWARLDLEVAGDRVGATRGKRTR